MFKIGEFSKLAQVSIRMLRYYDENGLLAPATIDPVTGYRLYSAKQLPKLNKIVYLRDSGFTVSEIAAAINEQTEEMILAQLDKKYREIEKNIACETLRLTKIQLAKKELLAGEANMPYQVVIKSLPSQQVLTIRKVISDYYHEDQLWAELSMFVDNKKIAFTGNSFSIYHDADYREVDVDVEVCLPVKVKQSQQLAAPFALYQTDPLPTVACMMVYGDFTNIAGAYMNLAEWLQTHPQYKIHGSTRQVVHRGPWNEKESVNYLTEIQIPLAEIQ